MYGKAQKDQEGTIHETERIRMKVGLTGNKRKEDKLRTYRNIPTIITNTFDG